MSLLPRNTQLVGDLLVSNGPPVVVSQDVV